jgi:6,7-dimethyl-8-ribityllumazine synthase
MIKWVSFAAQAKTEEDFSVLTRLLEALGFGKGELEKYPHLRLQSFTPTGSVLEVTHRKAPRAQPDLELMISDPDTAVDVLKKMGLEIFDDHSGNEPKHTIRSFGVRLPGGTTVYITGARTTVGLERANAGLEGDLNAQGKRFAIIVSRFNSFITERLLSGAIDGLARCRGAEDVEIVRVPGAFEIPSAARTLAQTKKYDAIICLGCLLRGDTAHYDVIVNECARGIGQSAQETGVPHAFGVLTCDTLEQAIDRAGLKMGNKGFEAELAAVEMANLKTVVSKTGRRSRVAGHRKTSKAKGKGRR